MTAMRATGPGPDQVIRFRVGSCCRRSFEKFMTFPAPGCFDHDGQAPYDHVQETPDEQSQHGAQGIKKRERYLLERIHLCRRTGPESVSRKRGHA